MIKLAISLIGCISNAAANSIMQQTKEAKSVLWEDLDLRVSQKMTGNQEVVCSDGFASSFNCSGINMYSSISIPDLGCTNHGNDLWGWVDHQGNEIAIAGCFNGVSFVDVTDPLHPYVVGFLHGHNSLTSSWRDMKVYDNHVFIGSENDGQGIQIFDLSEVTDTITRYKAGDSSLSIETNPSTGVVRILSGFEESFHYDGVGSSHNLVINEDTGFLYIVGSTTCSGGLHIVDVSNPLSPVMSACHTANGYVHDAQCVIYQGPDTRYTSRELCFTFNEDKFVIVDVTDKSNIVNVAIVGYADAGYTHQGWLTEDHAYVLMDDEFDEVSGGEDKRTRTFVWNVQDLSNPVLVHKIFSTETVIDHNQYIHNGYSWQSNYCGGLRVLDVSSLSDESPPMEVAFFDVSPVCQNADINDGWLGSWSAYPFFPSGNIAVQSIEGGLFMLNPVGDMFQRNSSCVSLSIRTYLEE